MGSGIQWNLTWSLSGETVSMALPDGRLVGK